MTEVIKRNQSKEEFDTEKIRSSVRAAAQDINMGEEKTREVVERVSRSTIDMAQSRNEIESSAIREKILGELDRVEPSMSEAWRKFDQKNKGQ